MTLKDKIAALLAKAESSTHEAERDAFNAKAEELMLKHGIEQAELESAGKVDAEKIVENHFEFKGDYAVIAGTFVYTVALAIGNLTVFQSRWRSTNRVSVVGHSSDVERAMQIIGSLHAQAMTAAKRWWRSAPERDYLTPWEGYLARRTYITSFASGAASRIRSERKVAEATASKGAELVLASKQEKVDKYVADKYSLKANRGRTRGSAYGSSEGFTAGTRADVGTTRVGGSRTAVTR